ncbi:MAG: hypothetical protein JNN01_06670 [Opitutaceae bacterium]|nr:hypothetical protein [Opitutaceae bacterium]
MFASLSPAALVVGLSSCLLFVVGVGFVVHAVRRVKPAHKRIGRYGAEDTTETRLGPLVIGIGLLFGGIILLVLARDLTP